MICHVCGSTVGVRKPRRDVPPTCPRNECQLAATGMIDIQQARARLKARGVVVRIANETEES